LSQQFPSDFTQKIKEFVDNYPSQNDQGKITIEVTPTQADQCVAKCAVGDVDAIISGDSDFASMYVGPSAPLGYV
jgi:hypothetical protein